MMDNLTKWFSRRLTAGAASAALLLTPGAVPDDRVWPFALIAIVVIAGLTIVDAVKAFRGEKEE